MDLYNGKKTFFYYDLKICNIQFIYKYYLEFRYKTIINVGISTD